MNSLLTLDVGENLIYLQDFILQPNAVDSITSTSDKLSFTMSDDKNTAVFFALPDMEHFVDVKLWTGSTPYSLPCRKTDKINYTFLFNPTGNKYKQVEITGQLNNWNLNDNNELTLNKEGYYEGNFNLSPASYTYQLILDGVPTHDPSNPRRVENGEGGYNSVIHINGQNQFCPILYTDENSSTKITLGYQNEIKDIFIYWQNYLLPDYYYKILNGKIIFDIPAEARERKRSYIRVWVSNDYGVSNDILIPLNQGKVVSNRKELRRTDKYNQIIYYILTDRFYEGDLTNNVYTEKPGVDIKVDFHGGDIAGITQKINEGYFKNLGVNTLWISPLTQNPAKPYGYIDAGQTRSMGYHGYWPVSSIYIDPRFGTDKDFEQLISLAHKNNMNVMMDFVGNYVHEEHPIYKETPDFATPLYLPDGKMNIKQWEDYPYTTWVDTFLPTLDFSRFDLIDLITDSALYWFERFDIDGFRHEECKYIPWEFWRTLTLKTKMRYADKSIFQIGSTTGNTELLSSYLTSGIIDGQFDCNLYEIALRTFAGSEGYTLIQLYEELERSLKSYGYHHLMGNRSGSYEHPRFMAYASGDLSFSENAETAGWTRNIQVSDPTAYRKLFLLHAFNMVIPGIPVIYYGDEIGITGAGTPDNHRMMYFTNVNNHEEKLKEDLTTLTKLRAANPVLIFGDFINLRNEENAWIFARKYFEDNAIIFINNSNESRTFEVQIPDYFHTSKLTPVFNYGFSIQENKIMAEVPAFGVNVFINKQNKISFSNDSDRRK